MTATLAVKLYDTQDDFVMDQKRYTAFIGGRNSGKTFAGSVKAVKCAAQYGGLGCIAAPSFPMLEHGAKAQFIERLTESGEPFTKTRDSVQIPRFNAEVLFSTLESEARVRGPNFSWGWADEVEYVADRSIWKALKGAVRDGPNPELFVTSTPKGRRLVWDEWVVGKTAHHALYKATTFDNPFIDAQDYVSGLGYEGVFYEQEITADFVTFEGLVYPGFNRSVIIERDCSGWATILCADIGARNPTAVYTIRVGADVERHIERELYRRGMSSDEITDAIAAEADATNPEVIFLDPSARAYIDTLQRRGYPAVPANNEVVYGIGVMTTAIADGMTVDPSCVNFVAEIESYAYPENKTNNDKPVKSGDHAMDAIRYGLVGVVSPIDGPPEHVVYDEPVLISTY